jgi:opacity protein-like surface antigen
MKTYLVPFLAAVLLANVPAHGQGLLSIGPRVDYAESVPLTYSVNGGIGYDRIDYGDPGIEDVDSAFIYGGVGVMYGNDNRVTQWNIGADFGTLYYLDDAGRDDEVDYSARVSFNIAHQFSRRLKFSDNLYFSYETEPDYGIGATSGRRAGQYVYGYNHLDVSYAWSERVSTTSGYTVEGIRYTEDELVGRFEDRISHTFSQDISYALSRTTNLVAEYRFRITDYRDSPEGEANPDYTSHYLLAGVEQAWSERTNVSLRAGAEIYQSDRADEVAPYVEGSLNYALSRRTTARFYGQAGFDASELGSFDSRYSYRTGIIADHQFTSRLAGSVGLHYIHSEYEGNETLDSTNEDEVNASVGVSYNFWNNLSLDASYSYTTIASDAEFSDYDRHRLSLGLNATF